MILSFPAFFCGSLFPPSLFSLLPPLLQFFFPTTVRQGDSFLFKKFTYLRHQSFGVAKLVCRRKLEAPGCRSPSLACEAFRTQAVGGARANHPVVGRINLQQYADAADQGLVGKNNGWGAIFFEKLKIFNTKM